MRLIRLVAFRRIVARGGIVGDGAIDGAIERTFIARAIERDIGHVDDGAIERTFVARAIERDIGHVDRFVLVGVLRFILRIDGRFIVFAIGRIFGSDHGQNTAFEVDMRQRSFVQFVVGVEFRIRI